MAYIHPKVLEDLEFFSVLEQIAKKAYTNQAKDMILKTRPATSPGEMMETLRMTDEYLKAIHSGNLFPDHAFEPFGEELENLQTENYFFEPQTFLDIARSVDILLQWKKFFSGFKEYYPVLYDHFSSLNIHKIIPDNIYKIVHREAYIKDNASDALASIRQQIRSLQQERYEIFRRLMKKYDKKGYLDEIKESVAEGRPVLAVKPAYRKQIDGLFYGTSRSGNIIFIEPGESAQITKKIELLKADEQSELIRILRELTAFLRPYEADLYQYERFLIMMDVIRAKALYAQEINAVLPQISQNRILDLKKAFHPLLWLENKARKKPVIPQNIHLDQENRIMVISGPNAGGKSITLKTVGLIQLMIQSGLLVPVHPSSQIPFFSKILTDIGDHQSIENQLSTYSYRLKNMRMFLRLVDPETLFLIDEFGTGSDPELGGALAEVFLEEFARSGAYGVITTHYNNLKITAEKLSGLFNAHMEFDIKKMEPTYRLINGDAGSSYTFEVARKMGIPYAIINRAKKKVHRDKVKYDHTLAELQDKKRVLSQQEKSLQQALENLKQDKEKLEKSHHQVLKKLEGFRILFEEEKHKHEAGEKIISLFKSYAQQPDKKKLWKEIMRWLEKEYIKQEKKKSLTTNKKIPLQKIKKEVKETLQQEDVKQKLRQFEVQRMEYVPRPGDRVRMKGSMANATLEKIENNEAVLDYGKFKARVPLNELELVMRKKD